MRRSTLAWLALGVTALLVASCAEVANVVSENVLATGPNGPETPAMAGVPFERVSIPSHSRRLDGYLVRAPADCKDPPAILIYHGYNETISRWVAVQALLWRHCVSSLVFDPSGEGDSTRPASLVNLGQDAPAAWAFARARFPARTRLYVLGHSMGDAVMLAAEPHLNPQPAGVIVADAFSSIKDYWSTHGTSRLVMAAMPDWWDNVHAIAKVHVPVLVVGSDADVVTPLDQGQRVFQAANPPKQMAVLHGYKHNGIRMHTSDSWWAPVLKFVGSPGMSNAPLSIPAGAGSLGSDKLADETEREDLLRAGAADMASSTPASAVPDPFDADVPAPSAPSFEPPSPSDPPPLRPSTQP